MASSAEGACSHEVPPVACSSSILYLNYDSQFLNPAPAPEISLHAHNTVTAPSLPPSLSTPPHPPIPSSRSGPPSPTTLLPCPPRSLPVPLFHTQTPTEVAATPAHPPPTPSTSHHNSTPLPTLVLMGSSATSDSTCGSRPGLATPSVVIRQAARLTTSPTAAAIAGTPASLVAASSLESRPAWVRECWKACVSCVQLDVKQLRSWSLLCFFKLNS